jgi:ferritin-like metal-binding protein YciE
MADTGIKDSYYDVISTMYHALQGAETAEQYMRDSADDKELQQFFKAAHQQYRELAQQGRDILKRQTD